MQLPFIKKQEPEKNFFLALLIKPYRIGAILFEEINSKLFILSTNETEVDGETDTLSSESILTGADQAISFIEASLPEGASVDKTIFSVPYDWIVDGKIEPEHLSKLKKVCEALGLVPMGYLTSIEAIVSSLQHQEGAPVSALFVEVAKKKVFIYLVRAGKILETQEADVTEDVLSTVNNLLTKIHSVDVLPSKIILLDDAGAEGAQQEFLSHQWPKDIPFLHLPQVMVLERGFENEATINGVAQQMELEVLQDLKTTQVTAPEEILEEASADTFGFVKEKDVAEKSPEKPAATAPEIPGKPDSSESPEQVLSKEKKEEPSVVYFRGEGEEGKEAEGPRDLPQSSNGLPILASILQLSNLFRGIKIPKIKNLFSSFSGGSGKSKIILLVGAVIIFIITFAFIYYNFILSARISVFEDKKSIDKTANVTFAVNPSGSDTIKIDTVTEEVKGNDSKNSTGTKETGNKATGSVTIYNKTDNPKTFPKGTVIIGPNSLEFQTQSDVSVASTSAFATSLSSVSVKITASKFGKEYNLPSGSNFTVKGFSSSDFIAKNSDATSGGTKTTSTVVSQKDLDDLLSEVTDKLNQDAVSKAKQSAGADVDILPQALSADVTSKTFSKKAGDEVGSVGVAVTIKYTLGRYSRAELQKFITSLSQGQIPGTYTLKAGDSKVKITDVKAGNNSATAKLTINAVYTPSIDSQKLTAEIKGKSESSAAKQIKNIVGVTDVIINFSRRLPLFPGLLPFNPKNISVEVKN